jgi:hypothetical protein
MALIQNVGYILIGFIALVSVFLIILSMLEKKLHLKFLSGRYARNDYYIEKISKIDINNPKESLSLLDKTAKSFFREAFHLTNSLEDSELESLFIKKNNKKVIEFSRQMTLFLYAGQAPTKEKVQELLILLAEIISSNKIISKEHQKELDEKSKKSQNTPIIEKIPFVRHLKK